MQIEEEYREPKVYDLRLLRWVWTYISPYKWLFVLYSVLLPLNTQFMLGQPYIIKVTVDTYLSNRPVAPPAWIAALIRWSGDRGLTVLGVMYLILVVGEFATFYASFYLSMMIAQYSLSDLRHALFKRVELLPMRFFDRTPVGRLVSRMTADIDAINEMFASGAPSVVNDLFTLVEIVVIWWLLSPRLALWALCVVPPLVVVVNFLAGRSRDVQREIRERLAALLAYLSEALQGMAVIQLFTRERLSEHEFDLLNLRSRDAQMRSNMYDAALFSSVEAIASITVALILWAGGGRVIRGAIELGTLMAFMQYSGRFFGPLQEMSGKYNTLQSALAAVEKIMALMEQPLVIESPPAPKKALASRGAIVFEHVNFEYRSHEPVLHDLSFTVEPGQKIAIVGATGSGKTTIIKLLSRFYDVTGGRILVDGVDVREWDLNALRREIGLVQQDVFLFAGDVLENVRLGLTDLTETQVRDALRRAQALRFVERMPRKLGEAVSERGSNMSAGQRQLLSFARALAYDPRILVMDEATSSIDSETERLIQLALNELLADRTALMIAHRLSTIERADRIMVLHLGVLRESGTHDELLAQRGLYYKLFELQYAAGTDSAREAVG
ncbi:MAG TPA: ABC transporter ATP-binding protein [Candidatus Binataceae bacterium]|nr:ABC transporter ATP-binding protein [Candidatus Binataceae bacterium]